VESGELPTSGIAEIEVDGLFGRYSYRLVPDLSPDPELDRVIVMWGDNGSGKTTILNALFHLLSSADNQGHRSALADTPFRRLRVVMADGATIAAYRQPGALLGPYQLALRTTSGVDLGCEINLNERNRVTKDGNPDLDTFLDNQRSVFPFPVFLMGDDRSLLSDAIADDEDDEDVELVVVHDREGRLLRERVNRRSRSLNPKRAVDRAVSSLRDQTLGASQEGGQSTNAIYTEIVRRIVDPPAMGSHPSPRQFDELFSRVAGIEQRSNSLEQYGLLATSDYTELIRLLHEAPPEHYGVLQDVLEPFIQGVEARLAALSDIHDAVDAFVSTLRQFFRDKEPVFHLSTGLRVVSLDGAAMPLNALSSGERHLVMLLATTLSTQGKPGLFLIDEPELSLNIKWQRRLVDALLRCTRGTASVFLFASHSLEIVNGALGRAVGLQALEIELQFPFERES
jgi:ABC-type Mn2+/Zn2+ transport system ATPase subunit